MLKKISVRQAAKGMYIQKLEGSWMGHDFWRTRFLIQDDATLEQLLKCGAAEVWIDVAQGDDVPPSIPETPTPATSAPAAPSPAPAPKPTEFRHELKQAELIRDRAGVAVRNMFHEARMGAAIEPDSFVPVVTEIVDSVTRHGDALISLSRLKSADEYTYMHSVAVCALMVSLGRTLGLSEDDCRQAGMAGLMHDIGKAGTPLEVLNKPGALTDEEFEVIRRHPEVGERMLRDSGMTNEKVLDVVRHHHEKMNGKGYPDRLEAKDITILARMGAVCDVYDAITSNRPYKAGWDPAESLARMASWKGQFDEEVLKAFIKSLGIYPTGSLVRLSSGRLAVVVEQNQSKITSPKVKVFFSTNSGTQVRPQPVDLSSPGCTEKILGREPRENWPFENVEELWRDEHA
jgi:putative nucleotidyltransferase with HDIG domain